MERDRPLAKARGIAQSQLDNEIQAKLGAQAAVESNKAAVEKRCLRCTYALGGYLEESAARQAEDAGSANQSYAFAIVLSQLA